MKKFLLFTLGILLLFSTIHIVHATGVCNDQCDAIAWALSGRTGSGVASESDCIAASKEFPYCQPVYSTTAASNFTVNATYANGNIFSYGTYPCGQQLACTDVTIPAQCPSNAKTLRSQFGSCLGSSYTESQTSCDDAGKTTCDISNGISGGNVELTGDPTPVDPGCTTTCSDITYYDPLIGDPVGTTGNNNCEVTCSPFGGDGMSVQSTLNYNCIFEAQHACQTSHDSICGGGFYTSSVDCEIGATTNYSGCENVNRCNTLSSDIYQCQAAGCFLATASSQYCGNGVLNPPNEDCDFDTNRKALLFGQTCQDFGYSGGAIGCNIDCKLNLTQCSVCGNGIIESGEKCDNGKNNGPCPNSCNNNCQLNECHTCLGVPKITQVVPNVVPAGEPDGASLQLSTVYGSFRGFSLDKNDISYAATTLYDFSNMFFFDKDFSFYGTGDSWPMPSSGGYFKTIKADDYSMYALDESGISTYSFTNDFTSADYFSIRQFLMPGLLTKLYNSIAVATQGNTKRIFSVYLPSGQGSNVKGSILSMLSSGRSISFLFKDTIGELSSVAWDNNNNILYVLNTDINYDVDPWTITSTMYVVNKGQEYLPNKSKAIIPNWTVSHGDVPSVLYGKSIFIDGEGYIYVLIVGYVDDSYSHIYKYTPHGFKIADYTIGKNSRIADVTADDRYLYVVNDSSIIKYEQSCCPNGRIESEEQCDDGNANDWDACRTTCKLTPSYCGDGINSKPYADGRGLYEECDRGPPNGQDNVLCSQICMQIPENKSLTCSANQWAYTQRMNWNANMGIIKGIDLDSYGTINVVNSSAGRKFSANTSSSMISWSISKNPNVNASGIVADRSRAGVMFVPDSTNHSLYAFSIYGTFYDDVSWNAISPRFVSISKEGNIGYVYIVDKNQIRKLFEWTYGPVRNWSVSGTINGIANDVASNVYVLTSANVLIYSSTGSLQSQFSGAFNNPGGIFVDNKGYVWVADTGNNVVKKFSATGTLISIIDIPNPRYVSVGDNSMVYIATSTNVTQYVPSCFGTCGNKVIETGEECDLGAYSSQTYAQPKEVAPWNGQLTPVCSDDVSMQKFCQDNGYSNGIKTSTWSGVSCMRWGGSKWVQSSDNLYSFICSKGDGASGSGCSADCHANNCAITKISVTNITCMSGTCSGGDQLLVNVSYQGSNCTLANFSQVDALLHTASADTDVITRNTPGTISGLYNFTKITSTMGNIVYKYTFPIIDSVSAGRHINKTLGGLYTGDVGLPGAILRTNYWSGTISPEWILDQCRQYGTVSSYPFGGLPLTVINDPNGCYGYTCNNYVAKKIDIVNVHNSSDIVASIVSPGFNETLTTNLVNLKCYGYSGAGLSSVQLWLSDNAGSNIAMTDSRIISGTSSVQTFAKNLVSGKYIWSCKFTDSKGKSAWTYTPGTTASSMFNVNIYVAPPAVGLATASATDTTTPIVYAIKPGQGSVLHTGNVSISCSASDNGGLSRVDLYLSDNTSRNNVKIDSHTISGAIATTTFTRNLSSPGIYAWNCRAFDTSGNSAWTYVYGTAYSPTLNVTPYSFDHGIGVFDGVRYVGYSCGASDSVCPDDFGNSCGISGVCASNGISDNDCTAGKIQMKCGISSGNIPACVPANPIPALNCTYNTSCVYGNESGISPPGINTVCYTDGSVITNLQGNSIQCNGKVSGKNYNIWCAKGFVWDNIFLTCVPTSSSCLTNCPYAVNVSNTSLIISNYVTFINSYLKNPNCISVNPQTNRTFETCGRIDAWTNTTTYNLIGVHIVEKNNIHSTNVPGTVIIGSAAG